MQTTYLKKAKPVLDADVKALRQGVEEIIDTVRKDGDAALAHYAKTFDDFEGPMRVGEAEFEAEVQWRGQGDHGGAADVGEVDHAEKQGDDVTDD